MSAVELKNVSKNFGKVAVIHGVSMTIDTGEFVVIVGPSGCGKSTLLRMVAGLEDISGGHILIGERVVNDLEPKDRDIAMVFQNYALYPHMRVYDNMAYGLRIRGLSKDEIDRHVRDAAKILELEDLLDRKPRQLSGGQRQRVAMGRAIVRDPKVFLFDEPLSNLDAKLRVQMRLELQKLHRRLGVTSLYVTHDQVEAMTLGSRIVVMNAGRVEQIGTPDEVYNRPATTFVAGFIGSPPMNLLNGRISADGSRFEINGAAAVLPQARPALVGRDLVLGLRPESLQVGGSALQADVELVESLGSDHMIHARIGKQALVVRTAASVEKEPNGPLAFGYEASAEQWFDAQTTRRIEL
jgi:sn-glycerol 3-phosphate transport system ATP-binding protein